MKAAIYSRKSIFTGKGESIENQIELCREYGDKLGVNEYIIYEDEGFSGGNIKRPRFQQLLKDVKLKKFDLLICYRLDRISRNVADFSSTLDTLQKYKVNFISIREQFDTSTPMGRAMIYIASVFAQLERETIAERVKDNMLELSKTGRWLGGQEPFGFNAERVSYLDDELKEHTLMKLTPIDNEYKTISLIFSKFLELHSLTQIANYLNLYSIKGKNGGSWSSMQLKRILTNPLYVKSSEAINRYLTSLGINVFGTPNGNGYLTYNKTKNITEERDITEWIAAIGKHPGIIDDTEWLNVQNILEKENKKINHRLGTGENLALLTGLLKCAKCGANMKIKQGHKSKDGKRIDYYVCSKKDNTHGKECDNRNIRVDILDNIIISKMEAYNKELFINELSSAVDSSSFQISIKEQDECLEEQISLKKTCISNLIKKLSLTSNDDVAGCLLKEVENLNEEINTLKEKHALLQKKEPTQVSDKVDSISYKLMTTNNSEFAMIKEASHRRNLLRTIIDEITWDGNEEKVKIKFLSN